MSCQSCFEANVAECPDSISVIGQLNAATNYSVVITDKFGERFIQTVTTDSGGSFIIDVSQIPPGTFNRHAGNFTIEVFEALTDCEPQSLTFCCDGVDKDYKCIVMSFYQSEGGGEVEIGCNCD